MSESNPSIVAAKQRHGPQLHKLVQCCATCEKLTDAGYCEAFEDYPPEDFIEQENDCHEYVEAIPF